MSPRRKGFSRGTRGAWQSTPGGSCIPGHGGAARTAWEVLPSFGRGLQQGTAGMSPVQHPEGSSRVWGHNFSEETTLTDKGCGSTAAGRGTLEGTEGQKGANRGFSPC